MANRLYKVVKSDIRYKGLLYEELSVIELDDEDKNVQHLINRGVLETQPDIEVISKDPSSEKRNEDYGIGKNDPDKNSESQSNEGDSSDDVSKEATDGTAQEKDSSEPNPGKDIPNKSWTNDSLKAYMDENGIKYMPGDNKAELLSKIQQHNK